MPRRIKVRADGVYPGDVLLGVYDLRGERLTRLSSREVVQSVDYFTNDNGAFAMLWTCAHGGPTYCTDTLLEVETP